MKTNSKDLDTFFALLKHVRPTQPGLTREEIRIILGSASTTGSAPRGNVFNWRTGMTALIVSILAGIAVFYATHNHVAQNSPAQQRSSRIQGSVKPLQTHPEVSQTQSPAADNPAPDATMNTGSAASVSGSEYQSRDHASAREDRNTTTDQDAGTKARAALIPELSGTSPQNSPHLLDAPVHPTSIPGARMLELTEEEMGRLGITVRDNQVEVYGEDRYTIETPREKLAFHKLGFDTTIHHGILRLKVTAKPKGVGSTVVPNTRITTISQVSPIVVTSDWLKNGETVCAAVLYLTEAPLLEVFGMKTEELHVFGRDSMGRPSVIERNSVLANKLIPIRIRTAQTEEEALKSGVGEYMVWYFPTDEFVAALPERYSVPLRKELDLIADVERHTLTSGEVCQRLTGETFFDYCRRNSGVLSVASVYPNPSKGDVTCRFSLKSGRTLSLALYDISGRHLRDLTQAQWMEPGDHDLGLKMEGAKGGAYLVVIRTSEGEQVVQRVIVK